MIQDLKGSPIGFAVEVGKGNYGQIDQIITIQVIYNTCSCNGSFFLGPPRNQLGEPFADMETVYSRPVSQEFGYIENLAWLAFGSDCGNYVVKLEPALPFFEFVKEGDASGSAVLDPFNREIFHKAVLNPSSEADIGRYEVKMIVYQDLNLDDNGFFEPARGALPNFEYSFIITISPCQVDLLENQLAFEDVIYQIGQADVYSSEYDFIEIFDSAPVLCGYQQTVSVEGMPSFVELDAQARKLRIHQTFDISFVGVYNLNIVSSVDVPDYTLSNFHKKSGE